jgi:hypothetical protein
VFEVRLDLCHVFLIAARYAGGSHDAASANSFAFFAAW